MKKVALISVLLTFMFVSSVHALSWAIMFVVWDGKVYEVKPEEIVEKSEIGKVIGEVKTQPDEETGEYYGNASNYYPIGTKYYEIKGISTSKEIAVKDEDHWVKAVYTHKAPFHTMNVMTNPIFIVSIGMAIIILISLIYRKLKLKSES